MSSDTPHSTPRYSTRVKPENVAPITDQCQSWRVTVAAAVKVTPAEASAMAAPWQWKMLLAELCEKYRKLHGHQESENGGWRRCLGKNRCVRIACLRYRSLGWALARGHGCIGRDAKMEDAFITDLCHIMKCLRSRSATHPLSLHCGGECLKPNPRDRS
jgi:hypothetical protein